MDDKLQRLFQQLIPFIVVGIGIALAIGLLIMFSYALMWGILIGFIIWLIALIKQTLFPSKNNTQNDDGRIIEHEHDKEE